MKQNEDFLKNFIKVNTPTAFPINMETRDGFTLSTTGMTLRDYFAAQALLGMLTTCAAPALNGLDGHENLTAVAAYQIADAMLEARENNNA